MALQLDPSVTPLYKLTPLATWTQPMNGTAEMTAPALNGSLLLHCMTEQRMRRARTWPGTQWHGNTTQVGLLHKPWSHGSPLVIRKATLTTETSLSAMLQENLFMPPWHGFFVVVVISLLVLTLIQKKNTLPGTKWKSRYCRIKTSWWDRCLPHIFSFWTRDHI